MDGRAWRTWHWEDLMVINVLAAVVAGLAGTAVMTGMMLWGRKLNLPAVDAHGILGHMQHADRASGLGYLMHFALGAVFALGYAFVFVTVAANMILLGAGLGVIHWLLVGWMFAFAPLAHAGMQAGSVQETGPYMLKSLGVVGFIAGTVGHIVFGVIVALVYGLMTGSLGG
jgi:hypothetical protein